MKKTLTYEEYYDKVYGAWFGKCLGGAAGGPVEGIKSDVTKTMRELMDKDLPNDDLDLQLLWLTVLEEKGPSLTAQDLAQAWLEKCWYPFGEYGYFLKNYMRGIHPPYSGWFNNNYFYDGMGCPIRSEIWALINPGNPEEAARLAQMDASLDHKENAYWGETFFAVLESNAFFSADLLGLIKQALDAIEDCKLKRCVEKIVAMFESGESFETIKRLIQTDYSHPDFTNSIQNIAYTILALLFGGTDIEKVINLAISCGYDTDCTCATAAAIVGIIVGYRAIDEEYKEMLADKFVCGIDVVRPDDTISTLAKNTCSVGLAVAQQSKNISITEAEQVPACRWEPVRQAVTVTVDYQNIPAIGFADECAVDVSIFNHTDDEIRGTLKISDLPEGFEVSAPLSPVVLAPRGCQTICLTFRTAKGLKLLRQKNILHARFVSEDAAVCGEAAFGIAGAVSWRVTGPFIEPHESIEQGPHACHPPESSLPSIESMFSNSAHPAKEYLDERLFVENCLLFDAERHINAYEDLIPVDENFGLYGEATFYLAAELWFDEACERWVVLGNSDAYRLWMNGELVAQSDQPRVWQPHCTGAVVKFSAGANRVILKLTRRSEQVRFSFGIRQYDSSHYHRKKWETEFSSAFLA